MKNDKLQETHDKLQEILELADSLPTEAVASFLKERLGSSYEAALAYQGAISMLESEGWVKENTAGKYSLLRGALSAIATRSPTAGTAYALIDALMRTEFNEAKAKDLLTTKLTRVIERSV